jgi:hypothetical protein
MSKNNDLKVINGMNLDALINYIKNMIIKKGIATYEIVERMSKQELFQYVIILVVTENEYQKLKAVSNGVYDDYEEFKN